MTRTTIARSKVCALALTLGAGLALPASAGMPAAMDRLPNDAVLVVGVENIADFRSNLEALAARFNAPLETDDLDELLDADGLDADGSVAFAVFPGAEGEPIELEGENARAVVVVEVDSYDQFVEGFGGTPAAGIVSVDADGETIFLKNIGDGFAAVAPNAEVLEGFDGKGGNAAGFQSMFGDNGMALAASSDAFVAANVQALAPMMREGVEQMRDQMEMMAQMAGPQGEQMTQSMVFIDALADGFLGDGLAGLAGLTLSDDGVSIDLAANFREGSEVAGFFSAPGDTAKLFARLPDMPYYFAAAADMASPGLRTLVTNMAEMQAELTPEGAQAMDFSKMMTDSTGFAMVMGTTPAIMGGLFTNTVGYFSSDNPAQTRDAWKAAYADGAEMSMQGMTMSGEYNENALEIAGASVDSWSMTMTPDANNPAAMQMRQMMAMMYGPAGGPSGYTAEAGGGLVSAFSQNQGTMALAINAANEGNGLSVNDRIMKALPDGSSSVVLVGIGSIGETVTGFMAMMGGGPNIEIPGDLPPIAIGTATDHGGTHTRVYIPMEILDTVAEIAAEMNGGGGGNGGNNGGAPRF
ncbi:MAG: hypothetical protein AAGG07_00130 [Planctomycetota bacterium]